MLILTPIFPRMLELYRVESLSMCEVGTALYRGYWWDVQWADSHGLLRSHQFQLFPCHARHAGISVWLLLAPSPWKYPAALPYLAVHAFLCGCQGSRVQVTISRPHRFPLLFFSDSQPRRESHSWKAEKLSLFRISNANSFLCSTLLLTLGIAFTNRIQEDPSS